jgi:adenosine deaminase
MADSLVQFLKRVPKAELHMHIEGSLEPELLLTFAERNRIRLPYASIDDVRAAYQFTNLQSFLDLYFQAMAVLRTESDFYDLTWRYLEHCREENVVHAEIFFNPQSHTARGIAFETVLDGITGAFDAARRAWRQSAGLILGFLRHESAAQATATLAQALPHRDRIIGVGLDSTEVGNPPRKHLEVFRRAREAGFRCVAHAGEEGPPEYIRQAVDELEVERIDHGVRIAEDPALLARVAERRIPLTVCPLSNVKLKVFPSLARHNVLELLDAGLVVTVNSDDPAYFGGFVNANLVALVTELGMTREQALRIVRNGFEASFLPAAKKAEWIAQVGS